MADAPKPEAKQAKYEPPKELDGKATVQKFQGRPKRVPVDQAEYFYSIKATHIVFFLSSVGMLISFLMMFHKDDARPWKPYQKQFAAMDFEKLWYDMNTLEREVGDHQKQLDELESKMAKFLGIFEEAGPAGKELPVDFFGKDLPLVPGLDKPPFLGKLHVAIDPETAQKKIYEKKLFVVEKEKIRGELYAKNQSMNFAKDEMGAARFKFEDAKHHFEEALESGSDRKDFYEKEFAQEKKEWDRVLGAVADRKAEADEVQLRTNFYEDFRAMLEAKASRGIWEKQKPLDELKKERALIVKERDDKVTRFSKEKPSFANTVRNAPGTDFFAPTLKVKQHILLDLKDQLNFAQVVKVDRCDTCHVSIGNEVYEVRYNPEIRDEKDEEFRYVFKNPFLRKFVDHARGRVDPDKCEVCDKAGREKKEIKNPLTPHDSWTSDDAIRFTKVFMAHPRLDLFVKDNSKHPIDKTGCTICHEGDGRDTDFTRVVHTPNSVKQGQDWRRRNGTPYGEEKYNWNYRELWDLPMFPSRYVQASCRRCHVDAVELDGGEKYVQGMKLVERVGCYGCHRIDTYQILEKDLQNPDIDANRKTRRPGPPLLRIATKVTEEWAAKWVLAPRDFRPTTKMPHFFGQSNCRGEVNGKRDYEPKDVAGVHRSPVDDTVVGSIVKYLWSLSETQADPPAPGLKADPVRGEILVKSLGCIACHKIEETPLAAFQDTAQKKSTRSRYLEEFAPTLSGVGSKMNKTWLYAWVRDPKKHFRDSNMPRLRLSEQDAVDVVEYLMTLKKPDWEKVAAPKVDPEIVRGLILEVLRKSMSDLDAEETVKGTHPNNDKETYKELKTEEGRVLWLGRKMVKNFGCYSCHQLKKEAYINPAKKEGDKDRETVIFDWPIEEGIGVELSGSQPWGSKHADKLDFGFTADDGVNHHGVIFKHGFTGEEKEIHVDETRQDWLEAKLRNPRVFDGGKMASKPWDELLRMPNFALNDHEIELIATFVLSFTDHSVAKLVENAKKRPTGEEMAVYRGDRVVRENNCRACHRLSLDTLEIEWARIDPVKNKEIKTPVIVEGRFGREESADDTERNLRKWKYLGEKEDLKKSGKKLTTFSWASDHRSLEMPGVVNPDSKFVYFDGYDEWYLDVQGGEVKYKRPVLRHHPMEGGEILAELRAFKKKLNDADKPYDSKVYDKYTDFLDPTNEGEFETRYPPMLRTQGVKTQAQWLYKFLKAPYPIRPTLQPIHEGAKALPDINLRMPTFFDARDEEAVSLPRWFALRDQKEGVDLYPYTEFPERDADLIEKRKAVLDKVGAVIKDATTGCASCHYMAGQAPPGAVLKHAPDLANVQDRLRPRWMYQWQADPAAIYPGTTMTQYDFKPLFGGNQKDGVNAAVEYLLNFVRFNSKSSANK